ncbi:MAG: hydrogenase expression/formation protein [Candidatus Glassbacteria bacterium]|nr:hydrogenase expression/formation protein [Candidatus Glassbacteria bacterium]
MAMIPTGKLTPELLAGLLRRIPGRDGRVIAGAQAGEDAAVIEFGDRFLIAASDPVTFAAERPAWYAVQINANDIAVMGGECRWLLATVLLPQGKTDESRVTELFAELAGACERLGVELVGGHTEVTAGLDRPLICGTMLGEAAPGRLCLKRNARAGDDLLLTKALAVEGTALIAREFPERLNSCCTKEEIRQAAKMLDNPGISVVSEARVALDIGGVHAMHDPTESGLAGAVRELADAAGLGAELEAEEVPIYDATKKICELLGLDPLGLLASGSLLIACEPASSEAIISRLLTKSVACRRVGRLTERDAGITEIESGRRRELRRFARDEIASLFD